MPTLIPEFTALPQRQNKKQKPSPPHLITAFVSLLYGHMGLDHRLLVSFLLAFLCPLLATKTVFLAF